MYSYVYAQLPALHTIDANYIEIARNGTNASVALYFHQRAIDY